MADRGLALERAERMHRALGDAKFDAFLALSAENLHYATGYRCLVANLDRRLRSGAFITPGSTTMAGPVADTAAAFDGAVGLAEYVSYGQFYFASEGIPLSDPFTSDVRGDIVRALTDAAQYAGLQKATIGIDDAAIGASTRARLAQALPEARFVDASEWALRLRSCKLPGEVALLERAAGLAEQGVQAALSSAAPGVTERELAAVVASVMAAGGGEPKFAIVCSGTRSALVDAYPSDRPIQVGDIIRLDVGCTVEGYWSDMARTAVVGEPSRVQAARYEALLAGEDAQLDALKPGVSASDIFNIAIDAVEANGLSPYRRQHCGHSIGLAVYEFPMIDSAAHAILHEDMTFSLETPYYSVGWGGMMIEDTVVLTDHGHRMLTKTSRELCIVPA